MDTVAQMTKEELREMIENIIEEKLLELLEAVAGGERGEPLAEEGNVHILFGNPWDHLGEIARLAAGIVPEEQRWWTIDREARAGDVAVFYLVRPLSCFIAVGWVTTDAWLNQDPRTGWEGYYIAGVDRVKLLSRPIPLAEIRDRFPGWAWLRQPRRSIRVPEPFARKFLEYIYENL